MATDPSAAPWYEKFLTDPDPTAGEDEGLDFLNKKELKTGGKFTKAQLVRLNNTLGYYGGDKPKQSDKKAVKQAALDQFRNDLDFMCVLTDNSMAAVALPVDVSTVRNYNLVEKGFQLPPMQTNDTSILLNAFLKIVGENYKVFLAYDEKEFDEAVGNISVVAGRYMKKTNYETLKAAFGNIIRYNIKYWYLHPWLSREEAHTKAMEHLDANYTKKADLVKIIKDLLKERKTEILKNQVLGLETIPKEGSSTGEVVFKENETAQFVVMNFLKSRNVKVDKNMPDVLECMQPYIDALTGPDKETFRNKFQNIVPLPTAVYLEKKRKRDEKEETLQRKKSEKEAWQKIQLERKQKIIEENANNNSDTATSTGADEATGVPRSNTTADKPEAFEVDPNDIFAEFKLKIGDHVTVAQVESTGRRTSNTAKAAGMNAGIKKTILGFTGRQSVKVQYTFPGRVWKKDIGMRLLSVTNAFRTFWEVAPDVTAACSEGCNGKVTKGVSRVVLSVMMHRSSKGFIRKVGVHGNFYETNFIRDVRNTKAMWLPAPLNGDLANLHGFYQLLCGKEDICGLSTHDRSLALDSHIEDTNVIPSVKCKMLQEIIIILQALDEEIESGDYGTKEGCLDPFDTKSLLAEIAEDKEKDNK